MYVDEVIPCVGFLGFFTIIFGTLVLVRWFRHREIMAMAEKGLLPEQYAQPLSAGRGRWLLGWGIALAALGLALMIGLWPIGFVSAGRFPLHFGPWMLVGLIPLFVGLGLLITYYLTRQEEPSAPEAASAEETGLPGN